jgi:hypothetical protein
MTESRTPRAIPAIRTINALGILTVSPRTRSARWSARRRAYMPPFATRRTSMVMTGNDDKDGGRINTSSRWKPVGAPPIS